MDGGSSAIGFIMLSNRMLCFWVQVPQEDLGCTCPKKLKQVWSSMRGTRLFKRGRFQGRVFLDALKVVSVINGVEYWILGSCIWDILALASIFYETNF